LLLEGLKFFMPSQLIILGIIISWEQEVLNVSFQESKSKSGDVSSG
jgi:hypothetical protein